jgi:hypothetical protein
MVTRPIVLGDHPLFLDVKLLLPVTTMATTTITTTTTHSPANSSVLGDLKFLFQHNKVSKSQRENQNLILTSVNQYSCSNTLSPLHWRTLQF